MLNLFLSYLTDTQYVNTVAILLVLLSFDTITFIAVFFGFVTTRVDFKKIVLVILFESILKY